MTVRDKKLPAVLLLTFSRDSSFYFDQSTPNLHFKKVKDIHTSVFKYGVICGQSYKHFTLVNYNSKVVIWDISSQVWL